MACNTPDCNTDHCCQVACQADQQNIDAADVCNNCPGYGEAGAICAAVQDIIHVLNNHADAANVDQATDCLTAASQ